MARLNIQVDLKEHEVLETQIKKEFEGIARGMAREAMKQELENEINRLIDAKLEEAKKTDYYNSIANNITKIVANKISRDVKVDTAEVNKIVQEKVEIHINNLMRPYGGTQDFIKAYINRSIAETLKKD
jgi:hypothetical protein